MIKAAGGIASIAFRRAFIAWYAVGRVAGSGSTSDTKTLSISGIVVWDKIMHVLGQQRKSDGVDEGYLEITETFSELPDI